MTDDPDVPPWILVAGGTGGNRSAVLTAVRALQPCAAAIGRRVAPAADAGRIGHPGAVDGVVDVPLADARTTRGAGPGAVGAADPVARR